MGSKSRKFPMTFALISHTSKRFSASSVAAELVPLVVAAPRCQGRVRGAAEGHKLSQDGCESKQLHAFVHAGFCEQEAVKPRMLVFNYQRLQDVDSCVKCVFFSPSIGLPSEVGHFGLSELQHGREVDEKARNKI